VSRDYNSKLYDNYRSKDYLYRSTEHYDRIQQTTSTAAKTLDSQKPTPKKYEEEKKITSNRKPLYTSKDYGTKDYGCIPGANDTKNFSRPPKAVISTRQSTQSENFIDENLNPNATL
jgi:hypothetical protein